MSFVRVALLRTKRTDLVCIACGRFRTELAIAVGDAGDDKSEAGLHRACVERVETRGSRRKGDGHGVDGARGGPDLDGGDAAPLRRDGVAGDLEAAPAASTRDGDGADDSAAGAAAVPGRGALAHDGDAACIAAAQELPLPSALSLFPSNGEDSDAT
jgi:hypothetical protein